MLSVPCLAIQQIYDMPKIYEWYVTLLAFLFHVLGDKWLFNLYLFTQYTFYLYCAMQRNQHIVPCQRFAKCYLCPHCREWDTLDNFSIVRFVQHMTLTLDVILLNYKCNVWYIWFFCQTLAATINIYVVTLTFNVLMLDDLLHFQQLVLESGQPLLRSLSLSRRHMCSARHSCFYSFVTIHCVLIFIY